MEWLILLVLVPAILVPVVLLGGFAGCSILYDPDNLPERPLPDAPTNLSARGINVSAIALTWNNPNTVPVTFKIERIREGDNDPTFLDAPASPFQDPGLEEGTAYFYHVRAIRTDDGESSALSEAASASTFGRAFSADLATDQSGLEGFCIVQRIEPPRLLRSGARVNITVRGSTTGTLTLDKITISQLATSGDPYDSHADLTEVASSVVVPANTAITLPTINYAFDRTRPLLIAFDISATPGLGNVRSVLLPGSVHYFRAATQQASVQDRFPDPANPLLTYSTGQGRHYLVERIEVA